MTTKLGIMVTYLDRLLPKKSHDPLIIWLRGFVRSHEKVESLYLHYQNAYGHQTWLDDELCWVTSTDENHMTLQSLCLMRSRKKLK